jgi:uncharacterized protein (DUF1015 family)
MPQIKPFAALRPDPAHARMVCAPPYDVLSRAEAKAMAGSNTDSFLHVSKSEIDFPESLSVYDEQVYLRARANFTGLQARGRLQQDPQPHLYLYRLQMGAHLQLGLVAVVSCAEYQAGIIKKHELTRPDKENDRVRHIESLDAQTGPAFLAYRARPSLAGLTAELAAGTPEIDFTAEDGIRHSSWTIFDPSAEAELIRQFREIPAFYIADGHHRSAAAARVAEARRGAGGSDYFLAVIFPHDQLQILPYHRLVADLNGLSPRQFLEQLRQQLPVELAAKAQPEHPNEVGLYLDGQWWQLRLASGTSHALADHLDVSRLQQQILAPRLGIADPRTSQRLEFVGGIRGTQELERRVDQGEFACAFALYPTPMKELMAVADAGEIMPPKSTWFEPKLRDGMFSHRLQAG